MKLSTLFQHSRPRFWHYLYGPMMIWWAYYFSSNSDVFTQTWWSMWFLIFAFIFFFLSFVVYFTFPANLFVYWVNDFADYDTDKFNTKKQWYEKVLQTRKSFLFIVFAVQIGYWLLMALLYFFVFLLSAKISHFTEILSYLSDFSLIFLRIFVLVLLPFLLLSWLYSFEPIRFKKRIFLDGISNVLYIITPTILIWLMQWYTSFQDISPLFWMWFAAAWLWCIAMHCFSAIPDIASDAKAGLKTTAIFLWKQWSLLYCIALYALAWILAAQVIGPVWYILWLIYCIMVFLWFYYDLFKIYKRFPYINFFIGWFLCFRIYFM